MKQKSLQEYWTRMENALSMPLSPAGRLRLTLIIGLLSAAICYLRLSGCGFMAADFIWPWRAARFLLTSGNPYQVIQPTGEYPTQAYYYYPLTSALFAIPFAPFHPY